jgi:V/A-type H+-transporting ATPase subunit E
MNGLDSIIDAIINEAEQQASQNIQAAQSEKAVLMSETEEELAAIEKERKEKIFKNSEMVIERAKSANDRYLKQQLMITKMQFIDDVIKTAQEKIKAMPADEYFAAMERLAAANAHKAEGVILFGRDDLARMPKSFIENCNKKIDGGSVKLSDTAADIDGGFVIRYGDVEENCSLDSIFRFKYDELCDIVNGFLSV